MLQLGHLIAEAMQEALPVFNNLDILVPNYLLLWNWRDEAPWPAFNQDISENTEFVKPPLNIEGPIFILSLYIVYCILGHACILSNRVTHSDYNLCITVVFEGINKFYWL
jgi:hypothetical protein